MPAALVLTALLAAAPAEEVETRTIHPGLWRLETHSYYVPPVPEFVAGHAIETVCVGDDANLDPSNLKPEHAPGAGAWLYDKRFFSGDPNSAYRIRFYGSPHIRPGFKTEAKRLGDCRKGWLPGARRVEKRELFPPPTLEEMEGVAERKRGKARR